MEKTEALEPEVMDEDEEEDSLVNLTQTLLSVEEMKFASAVATGDNFTKAYRDAFPGKGGKPDSVNILASRLVRNPKVRQQIDLIQQAVRLHFIMDAPRAGMKMTALSEAASSEKIQFEATKDILNRGGLQPPQRIETIHIGVFGSASSDDIRNMLRQRLENKEKEEE